MCSHSKTAVIESRKNLDGLPSRVRECRECGDRFITYEAKGLSCDEKMELNNLRAMKLELESMLRRTI